MHATDEKHERTRARDRSGDFRDTLRKEAKMRLRLWSIAFLAAVTTLAVGLSTSSASNGAKGSSDADPIKIGVLTSLTGPFTPWGVQARAGMELAVNEINQRGGVRKRQLSLDVVDDQSTPNAGIDGFRKLTEQDHVVSVGGVISSDVALATTRLAEQAHVPIFLVKAGATEILTSSSRYTFRTCLPAAAEVAAPILQFAQAHHVKSVGAIVADFSWGHSIESALKSTFEGSGIKLKIQVAPVRTSDFTPYLRAIAGSQLIVATGHPPGSGAILVQAVQLGMKVPVTGAYTPFSTVQKGAGTAAYGRWGDFKCMAVGSTGYKALAKRYVAAFPNNVFFEDDALAGYAYVKIVAEAIGKVGENPQKIAAYVHAHTFTIPGYAFPLKWTAWGELAAPRIAFDIITKGPPPSRGLNAGGDWWPREVSRSKPLKPYRPS
jgi:branched-chain amino acid transport system substrate-binding protein